MSSFGAMKVVATTRSVVVCRAPLKAKQVSMSLLGTSLSMVSFMKT